MGIKVTMYSSVDESYYPEGEYWAVSDDGSLSIWRTVDGNFSKARGMLAQFARGSWLKVEQHEPTEKA